MKQSKFYLIKSIKDLLLKFPLLVDQLEKKDPAFLHNTIEWIRSAETLFYHYNLSEVAELAGMRSKILQPKASAAPIKNLKKEQVSIASGLLFDLQNLLQNVLKPYEIKLQENRELIKQVLTMISDLKAIRYKDSPDFDSFVKHLWEVICSSAQLKGAVIKLKSQYSLPDIHILITEEVEPLDF